MYVYDERNERWIPLRSTRAYRQKRKWVRDGWIGVAVLMLALPPAGVVSLALFSTFFSFMVLDESVYEGLYQAGDDRND
jgi:hypothetical protein